MKIQDVVTTFAASSEKVLFVGVLTLGIATSAGATLLPPVNGMVYDDVLQIYWLQDANLAATNTFGVANIDGSGGMSWTTANEWISAMNMTNYLGFNDWRLPSSLNHDGSGPCSGFSCVDSEMGYLQHVDGITFSSPGIFSNIDWREYWSSTEYSTDASLAWTYSFNTSLQSANYKSGTTFTAWAVRPVTSVPEPETLSLMVAGLGVLALLARSRSD